METKKRGRKPKLAHLKVQMMAAYLKKEDKDLIVKEFGCLTQAVKTKILSPIYEKHGHSDSPGHGEPVAG